MEYYKLRKLCRYANIKPNNRGDYILCKCSVRKSSNSRQCIGNIWYPTGHASDDCDIDYEKINSCEYRLRK